MAKKQNKTIQRVYAIKQAKDLCDGIWHECNELLGAAYTGNLKQWNPAIGRLKEKLARLVKQASKLSELGKPDER